MAHTERLAGICEKLVAQFSDEELRTLCFDLGVDTDEVAGQTKSARVASLLELLDNRGRIPDLIARCATSRPDVALSEMLVAADAQSPFKGLAFYDVADAGLFVGREVLTALLIARISPSPQPSPARRGSRLLAVIGASGSGKSSLVRAGVVATLQGKKSLAEGALPTGCNDWLYRIITPTDRPLEALATALALPDESELSTARFIDELTQDERVLHLRAQKLIGNSKRRLFLLVDQFEELFTACKDKAQRKAFVDNLLYAANGTHEGGRSRGHGPTLVLLTLRADFYAQCFDFDNLREALGKHQAQSLIGAMTIDELRRTIIEPALRSGLEFEPGLVDLLLRDAGDEPGALPLLSHVLLETWKRRDGRRLTLAGYQASGGVCGAIAQTADSTLARMTPAQQAIARRIFVGLTELGEGAQDTRRRATLAELARTPNETEAVAAVLQVLADQRLVTTDRDANNTEMAEVAHEALTGRRRAQLAGVEPRRGRAVSRRAAGPGQRVGRCSRTSKQCARRPIARISG